MRGSGLGVFGMRTIFSVAVMAALAAAAVPAAAAPSNASFAYTGDPNEGRATLILETASGTIEIGSSRRGWVTETGANNLGPGNLGNYIVGRCGSSDACLGDNLERNNYFQFDVFGVQDILSATLQLRQPQDEFGSPGLNGYLGNQPFHTYTLYDVLTSLDGGLALFNDLRTGISYGSFTLDASTNGTFVNLALNGSALTSILDAQASNGLFNLGGTIELGSVIAVPEPASWAMLIAGFGLVGAIARRRQAHQVAA